MSNHSNIIVGVDFSESSRAAVHEAAKIARMRNCWLHIIHVIDSAQINCDMAEYLDLKSLKFKAGEKLNEFSIDAMDSYPSFACDILVGNPFVQIAEYCEKIQPSILFLGSYGNRGKSDRTGAIATQCIRKIKAPVMLVRQKHRSPFSNIVSCVDFSATSLDALQEAARMAAEHKAKLHILHIFVPMQSIMTFYNEMTIDPAGANSTKIKNGIKIQLDKESKKIKEEYPMLKIETHVVEASSASLGVVNFVRLNGMDLAALGAIGIGKANELLMGTTAERLIHQCDCGVLVVKPKTL